MKNNKPQHPEPSQVCRLFLLCVALISYVPAYVPGRTPERAESSRVQEPVQQQEQSQNQEEEPREIRQVRKDHPALRIKAIRNHKKKTWLRDMEIEVTNVANKPVYYILIGMEFPDIKPGGVPIGENLIFGNHKLISFGERPQPDDPFLKPGENYVFKLSEDRWKVMEEYLSYQPSESALKIDLEIEEIRFDDGSGFFNGDTFFRSQPRRVSYYPIGDRENSIVKRLNRKSANRTEMIKQNTLSAFPGKLVAVPASEEDGNYCWGSYCDNRMDIKEVSCWTKPDGTPCLVQNYFYVDLNQTQYPCANPEWERDVVCHIFSPISQQRCPTYRLKGCGPNEGQIVTGPSSPDATPTPTPTPECSFGVKPHYICNYSIQRCEKVNDCGVTQGDCNQEKVDRSLPCCNDPNQGYSTTQCNSNGVCDLAPVGTCKPVGELCNYGEQCPPPPPDDGGGGGGDTGGGGSGYYCTDYWWVETIWLCSGDSSYCYLLGSNVSYAGCW
jgi:hypothetical protein